MTQRSEEPSPYVLQMHNAKLEIRTQVDKVTAIVIGELDAVAAPQANEAMSKCVGAGIPLDIDMSGVTFIDSTGISLLIGIKRRFEERGSALRVLSPSPAVTKALDLVGLTRSFEVVQE